jgi:hypothetical protein
VVSVTYDRGSQRWVGPSRRGYWDPIPDKSEHNLMRDDRRMTAEHEFVLDQILTVLWKG